LPVFCFPAALLQPPVDDDSVPLAEILSAMLRLLAEHHDIDKTHFFFELIALLEPPAGSQPETRHGRPARRVSQLRIAGQIADQDDLIEPCHR